jgi:hypothetical protein
VKDEGIVPAHAFENVERSTPAHHEVLGDDFEPIDRRLALENLVVVIPAQTDAMSESLHAHVRVYSLI